MATVWRSVRNVIPWVEMHTARIPSAEGLWISASERVPIRLRGLAAAGYFHFLAPSATARTEGDSG
jgi:hypothetical protein